MNITINEPCHENWDAMTPNQQGAFCKSCQKNVVDFSKKTIAEIKDFFGKPQEGRVCGRFEETQLVELSFDDFFARFRYWNLSRKFAVIFFLSFGFWLFSNHAMAQSEKHMLKGEVAYYEPVKKIQKDTTKKQHSQPTNVKQNVIMGKIKCTIPAPVQKPKKFTEPQMMQGQVVVDPIIKHHGEPIQKKNPPMQVRENIREEQMILGMVVFRPQVTREAEPRKLVTPAIELVTEKSEEEGNKAMSSVEKKVLVYPNPSDGHFTVETKEKQTLYLLDETGKLVLTQQVNGSTAINAETLKSGLYTLHLTGNAQPTVKKIIITR
jgi:hypothetical protein